MADVAPELPRRHVLILVENISATHDRQLWLRATSLWRNHYEVSVICPKRRSTEPNEETIEGVRIFRHPLPYRAPSLLGRFLEFPIALFWELVLAVRIGRRQRFDVLHLCTPPSFVCLVGAIYKVFRKRSVILDYRDPYVDPATRADDQASFLERLAFRICDLCLVPNESTRAIAIKRGCSPAQKAIVLRPCPDLSRVVPMRPDPSLRSGRAHLVAYAGIVGKKEGVDLLLEAIDHIVHKSGRTDIQFIVTGTGPEWQEIAGICGKLALGEYVTFTGQVDDDMLYTILSTADVCVEPRPITRQNSVKSSEKILDYMAIGKPVVQFDTEEGRALAQQASIYAENNDPIDFGEQVLELIDNPHQRSTMGNFGQQRVHDDLSWGREERKLIIAYDALYRMREKRLAADKTPHAQKPKPPKKKRS